VRSRHTLVLAGGYGDGRPELARLADSLGLADRVVFTGRIEDADLPALYAQAAAYVTPSLEEGFGATVLEAMACGAPVVSSNRGALPEVVGDAGLLFDAHQEGELALVLARVLSDAGLADDLRRRSLARAGLYTSARTTGRVLTFLRELNDGAAGTAPVAAAGR
jgi:glycosyltransferase involved in cell wall biosynthesis